MTDEFKYDVPFSCNIIQHCPGKLLNRETGVRCGRTDFSLDTVSSHDSTMMAVPVGNRVHVYRTKDCAFLHDLGSHFMSVKSLAFSFDDHMLATGSWDGVIMLWNLTSGSLLSSVRGHTGF